MAYMNAYGHFIQQLRDRAQLIRMMDDSANERGMVQTHEADAVAFDNAARYIERLSGELDSQAVAMHMICARLGGIVDGQPTAPGNLLQRIDELVAKEKAMLTKEEIERLKTLCDAATPGPWIAKSYGDLGDYVGTTDVMYDKITGVFGERDTDNARFIAESRTALPAALETIEEQRKRIQLYLDGVTLDREPPYNETVGQRFERREQLQQICTELKECLK